MRGSIYTDIKCPVCGRNFKNDENRDGMFCRGPDDNPHEEMAHYGKCRVQFGETKIRLNSVHEAQQRLAHLRVVYQDEKYDPRDYRKDVPLGFANLADKWLGYREKNSKGRVLSASTLRSYRNYLKKAKEWWGNKNIKFIIEHPGEIEDFLFSIEGISEKTRANYKSCLHFLLKWVCRRERLYMPEFPDVPYELKVRTITDWDTQVLIINELKRISFDINPKIHLGIELLANHTNIRPQDLLRLTENDIDVKHGILTFWNPTKSKNKVKTVRLLPNEIEEILQLKEKFPAMPHMPFFRHASGIKGVRADEPFGNKYFYKWWERACENLGIKNLPLYPGTRHTTATEQAKHFGKDAAKNALGNTSNKSIERYIQIQDEGALNVVRMTAETRRASVVELKRKKG